MGLWREATPTKPAAGRLLAVDATRGVTVAAAAVDGAPEALGLSPARDRPGVRLYAAVATPEPDPAGPRDELIGLPPPRRWRLLGLDPATLDVEREFPLPVPALELAVAPDGRDAYAVATEYHPTGRLLVRIGLRTGAVAPLGYAPVTGPGGFAVTADRLYVADTLRDRLWTADRAGVPHGSLATGPRPGGIAAAPRPPPVDRGRI